MSDAREMRGTEPRSHSSDLCPKPLGASLPASRAGGGAVGQVGVPASAAPPQWGSPLHGRVEEVQQRGAVLAPVEAHAQLGVAVPRQGCLDGAQGARHLVPQRGPCRAGRGEAIRQTWGGGGPSRGSGGLRCPAENPSPCDVPPGSRA